MQLTKKEARKQIIGALANVDPEKKREATASLYQQLFDSAEWLNANVIATTISQSIEVDTKPIIRRAQAENKRVCIPRTLADWQMEFVELNEQTELIKTKHNLFEPANGNVISSAEIDLMIVPGVAYTADNFRLGFGGGYYDRYLAGYSGLTISLALPQQRNDNISWAIKPYDININHILVATEEDK
ncbi:5-formyltetrahydrofolate cyclo-ligase [Paucilactobacillus kaifaensis]|uniref:5-formyltetrahydrofolate cyclo-ligase n=1 Tax=Paucilactobacillus kaifaensis TaxID=2559921 RepID=UPI0010F957BE|nr:5-formyltetrahydrofolate cyclo-ligase [Paucilactobacillus kaifaensis]